MREKPREKEEMKRKNIAKMSMCMYCVRKNMSKYHFSFNYVSNINNGKGVEREFL
jgi:hypothetical protein